MMEFAGDLMKKIYAVMDNLPSIVDMRREALKEIRAEAKKHGLVFKRKNTKTQKREHGFFQDSPKATRAPQQVQQLRLL